MIHQFFQCIYIYRERETETETETERERETETEWSNSLCIHLLKKFIRVSLIDLFSS